MTENDIPEDIRRLSDAAANSCVERPYNKGSVSRAATVIARALLAERERCAKLAEYFIPASQDSLSSQIADLCGIIAATIRGGSHE